MKDQKGFSLVELLIVVCIIGIIAAIAIPNLLAAKRQSNETGVAALLDSMGRGQEACENATKSGYVIVATPQPGGGCTATASPQVATGVSATGTSHFALLASGLVARGKNGATPVPGDATSFEVVEVKRKS